ncbi:hypothetical protein ACFV2H_37415 [Streptomyces sp. NPDC059629]|uniref:hypothetical protein n=1 Tax=Streptomyces sp. NPDC059629 TaxID=3346889 RepID=UPI00369CEDC1
MPTIVGALALSQIADRHQRRSIIMTVEISRAAVVGAVAIPGIRLGVLFLLLQYPVGMSVRQITRQAAQIFGFVSGGVVSSIFAPQVRLAFDALRDQVLSRFRQVSPRADRGRRSRAACRRAAAMFFALFWRWTLRARLRKEAVVPGS